MTEMTRAEAHLLIKNKDPFASYYNGKMSYKLHGKAWENYVAENFPEINDMQTSENVFKTVIDLYAENLVPVPDELKGFSNCLVPLLSKGECVVLVAKDGTPHFAEHFNMLSDGKYTIAAIYTRDLEKMKDNVIFASSDGKTRLFQKDVPEDFTAAGPEGYEFIEEETGATLFRFALDDKGFGANMAAVQDRVNHSIIDQTVIAEMYARPFWYLLNVDLPAVNPYLPNAQQDDALKEHKGDGAAGRIFTTSSEGPFGQLTPPTILDMVSYHDSIIDKVSQNSGIPLYYFKPGSGTPPTGVALKVLSKRFNNRIARMRDDLTPVMEELAALLGVDRTVEVEGQAEKDFELWSTSDDLLQDALDQHGINLSQMGYPLGYIAEVVTPGVDLEDYEDDTDGQGADPNLGEPTDMTAMGQPGLPATPGQVQAYASNPGQRQKVS